MKSACSDLVAKYGTTNDIELAKAIGIEGAGAKYIADVISSMAWNWHTYGPKSTEPNKAMQDFVRRQAVKFRNPTNPTMKAILAEINRKVTDKNNV